MQVQFGIGTIVGRRLDIAAATPAFLGVTQSCSIDFDQTLKELHGQNKFPVDVAPAMSKITGKIKFARLSIPNYNNLLFGGTETDSSGFDMVVAEAHTMAAATYTVVQAATFVNDMGVYYAATGLQLNQVAAGAEATGSYSVVAATGVYTFAVGDQTAALLFYYTYNVTTLKKVVLGAQLMGSGPVWELNACNPYNVAGVAKKFNVRLNACRSGKLTHALANGDYMVPEMDFEAYSDATGAVMTWALTE